MTKHIKRVLEKLSGPTGSIVVHVVVIGLLVTYAGTSVQQETTSIELQVVEADIQTLDNIDDVLKEIEPEPQDLTDIPPPPDAFSESMDAPPALGAGEVGAGADEGPAGEGLDTGALNILADVSGPLVMKGLYSGRSSGGRAGGLAQYAGQYGKYTEPAVLKALEWLKNNQNPEGWWEGRDRVGNTGLALLTFLAHGETTSSEKYGQTVEKAIRYMVSQYQNYNDGRFHDFRPGEEKSGGDEKSYAHGIATYALSEAYGLTRIPSIKPVMENAVKIILDGQQSNGLWDYRYAKGGRWDTSVAGWQIQALKSAYIAGAETPGIKDALDRAAEGIKKSYALNDSGIGRFGYTEPGKGSDGLQGVGVLSLLLTGNAKSKEAQGGLDTMRDFDVSWTEATIWPLYAWYYITQAKFHSGGPGWTSWNSKFAREFLKNQNPDGSWGPPRVKSGDGEDAQGLAYCTTMAALTLQVYYRFLPTYKPIAVEHADEEQPSDDDVSIEII